MRRMPWEITPEMFLSEKEADALLTHVRSAAGLDRVIVETLLFSGIRNSELCRLTLGDLVVTKGTAALHVRGTGEENRTVYIPKTLGALLEEYVTGIRRSMLPAGMKANDHSQPLFINERGKPYERTGLYRRVTRILTDAGLGDRASVQLLRHTYGFLAYKRTGGNLLFVQRQLGHAHPVITSVYARLVDESYEDLAEGICPQPRKSAAGAKRARAEKGADDADT